MRFQTVLDKKQYAFRESKHIQCYSYIYIDIYIYIYIKLSWVVQGGGLFHIIKKDRLSTKFFAAIFREVAAVETGSVPPYSLVAIHTSPYLR